MARAVLMLGLLLVSSVQAQEAFLGKTAAEWMRQLRTSGKARERRNAAFALGKLGSRALAVQPELQSAAQTEADPTVRETILFALGDISRATPLPNRDELEKLFLRAMKDEDPLVRRSAAYALGCLGNQSEATREALERALDDRHAAVRQNAAWALGKIGAALAREGAVVLPALRRALRDTDSLVQRDAAASLLQVNAPDKVHALLDDVLPLCRDSNSEVRRAALNVLVRFTGATDKYALPTLRAALADKDLENRRNAALALTNIGGAETVAALPILLEAIRGGDAELRGQAVVAIHNIGPAAVSALDVLTRLLRTDTDDKVRRYAAVSLAGFGRDAEPAVPLLAEKVRDFKEDPATRFQCAMALHHIGNVPSIHKVLPDLLPVFADKDDDVNVRVGVSRVLNRIDRQTMKKTGNAFAVCQRVLKEPKKHDNIRHDVLRYGGAQIVCFVWEQKAPEAAFDVLLDGLRNTKIKIYVQPGTSVGGSSSETASGKVLFKNRSEGDGRVLYVNALNQMGVDRYKQRADIMAELRKLAASAAYEPLRTKAAELVKAAK